MSGDVVEARGRGAPAGAGPSRAATWSRVEATLWRRSADRVVLLAPGADDPVVLNATAAAVWHELGRPRATEALVTALATSHGVPAATVRADVSGFLEQLRAVGVVRREP